MNKIEDIGQEKKNLNKREDIILNKYTNKREDTG